MRWLASICFALAVAIMGFTATSASAEELTFRLRSNHPNVVDAEFYSQDRTAAWPGNGKVYSIDDSEPHSYKLSCRSGEKICYGAWVRGTRTTYWGAGYGGKERCSNCCFTCDGGVTAVLNLNR